MNQKKREILKIEEDFKDTLENDLNSNKEKEVKIKDIKLVGEIVWKDKINGKDISERVFIVEKEITNIDENGKERSKQLTNFYLGEKCIGGTLGNGELIYSESFKNSEIDKMEAINKLLETVSQNEIENNSLNKLQKEEIAEVLSAHYGRKITIEEVDKELERLDKEELQEIEGEQKEEKDNDKNNLSKKQAEKITVRGIQKVDLNKLVDGKETLGKRLDLANYDDLYVVYSDRVNEVTSGTKKNNTTYSLVGRTKDGQARVLNDEFEMDKTVGNNASRESTKIRADNTATRDNNDLSVYTRKSNRVSIGCENDMGNVNLFLYQKTLRDNENVGIQIETSKTDIIPLQTRNIMNVGKGRDQKDKVKKEIKGHSEKGCNPKDIKDFDGDENTSTHEHISIKDLNKYVVEILNYENEFGEEKIRDIFGEEDVRDKFLREVEKYKEKLSMEQIIKNVKEEMNRDAEMLSRERKL